MNQILQTIGTDSKMILALSLGPLVLLSIVMIVWLACRASVRASQEKEQTRREIAAYVAEGSMSAEDAERILTPRPWYADAWNSLSGCGDAAKKQA